MATMQEIEAKAKEYADERADLANYVQALEDEKRALVRRYLPGIKRRVAAAKVAREALHVVIKESADLFVKPRSVTVHGIKVGFQKGKGKVVFDDADKVVELIEKHFPELADTLVKTEKKPLKDAILALDVAQLKKIACRVTGTGDEVLIKDASGEVDKLVEALLADDTEEEGA